MVIKLTDLFILGKFDTDIIKITDTYRKNQFQGICLIYHGGGAAINGLVILC